jgi:hypothetical protein
VQKPVTERIAKLREEIAQIRAANETYFREGKKNFAAAPDHERRLQRLKEILNELSSLTEWKKT